MGDSVVYFRRNNKVHAGQPIYSEVPLKTLPSGSIGMGHVKVNYVRKGQFYKGIIRENGYFMVI